MIQRLACTSFAFRIMLPVLLLLSSSWIHAQESERWTTIKQSYFGDTPIIEGNSVITLEAPNRAHDAATVPVVINAMDKGRKIDMVYLFVDMNPIPLAGTFKFTEEAGFWNSLETRIRINEYTHCLLYTSPSPRDRQKSRMPSSA